MNFPSLNHILKKKNKWKIQGLTRGSTDWSKWRGPLTGGTGLTVNVDWSTINVDRAWTGLSGSDNVPSWARLGRPGLDMCRTGRQPHGASKPLLGLGPCGGPWWTARCRSMDRRHDPWWTASTLPPPGLAHGELGAPMVYRWCSCSL